MRIQDYFLEVLDAEAGGTRKALEKVPTDRPDWKPHPKSMQLGYLATLVATMPSWVAMMVDQPGLDLNPKGGGGYKPPSWSTTAELLAVHDGCVAGARKALTATDEDHLNTTWQLLVGGHVVDERKRYLVIGETFRHLAHHRGQLTVYLRLNDAPVPSIYGPSADDKVF